jgi:hypothetical protein
MIASILPVLFALWSSFVMGILGATLAYSFVYLIIIIIVIVVIFWLLIAVAKILPATIGWAICAIIIVIVLLLWLL